MSVRAFCREAPYIQFTGTILRQAPAYHLFPASDSYSRYRYIKDTHRKARARQSAARLNPSIDLQHSIARHHRAGIPRISSGLFQLKLTSHIVMIQQRAVAGCGLRVCHFVVAHMATRIY